MEACQLGNVIRGQTLLMAPSSEQDAAPVAQPRCPWCGAPMGTLSKSSPYPKWMSGVND